MSLAPPGAIIEHRRLRNARPSSRTPGRALTRQRRSSAQPHPLPRYPARTPSSGLTSWLQSTHCSPAWRFGEFLFASHAVYALPNGRPRSCPSLPARCSNSPLSHAHLLRPSSPATPSPAPAHPPLLPTDARPGQPKTALAARWLVDVTLLARPRSDGGSSDPFTSVYPRPSLSFFSPCASPAQELTPLIPLCSLHFFVLLCTACSPRLPPPSPSSSAPALPLLLLPPPPPPLPLLPSSCRKCPSLAQCAPKIIPSQRHASVRSGR